LKFIIANDIESEEKFSLMLPERIYCVTLCIFQIPKYPTTLENNLNSGIAKEG